jgi:hypothetical protein
MNIPLANVSIVLASLISLVTTPPAIIRPVHPVAPKPKSTIAAPQAVRSTLPHTSQRQAVSDFGTSEEVELERYRLKSKAVGGAWLREAVVG